jgi:F-type H+-transporting ATPase subunit a
MPEHTSFLTMVLGYMRETLDQNATNIGNTFIGNKPPSWHSFEPITAALLLVAFVLFLALLVRRRLSNVAEAVIPEERLTLRTFFEVFLGFFYDLAKGVMGAERAKQYFPIIGTSAVFVFLSNVMALIPGMPIATSSLNITLGCALVVFVMFNIYGLMANGLGYLKHLAGPVWYMAIPVFCIEVISLCVRPVTLSVRLMLNMSVDHLILGIIMGLVAILVPIPVQFLGIIIVVVQTLVFTLLTSIYIGLATAHDEEH